MGLHWSKVGWRRRIWPTWGAWARRGSEARASLGLESYNVVISVGACSSSRVEVVFGQGQCGQLGVGDLHALGVGALVGLGAHT